MILVLAGTSEGRVLARTLAGQGRPVTACTATGYGGELLSGSGCNVRTGPLDEDSLRDLIRTQGVTVLLDATHPYAREISALAGKVAGECGIPFLRYSRPAFALPDHPLVHQVPDFMAAARLAPRLGRVIFLATGSKTLDLFVPAARETGCRVVARVLPGDRIMERCLWLGLTPGDIVAMQGPFSKEMNIALLRHFRAEVMVTKEDGAPGGLGEKLAACLDLRCPLVVVRRPGDDPAGETDLEAVCAMVLDAEKTSDEGEDGKQCMNLVPGR
ncbi:MAG TPA: precorrin-6A reductase [Spirochaetia bacterium]|nr:precorrin-6A reductase [Spirochaetia bacterium]